MKHSLELGQVWCACRLGRKGIPSGNASHSERTFSYIGARTHRKNLMSVTSCTSLGRQTEQLIRLNARSTIKDLPTLDEISTEEPPLHRIQVERLQAVSIAQ